MLRVGIFVNIANQFGVLNLKKKGHKVNYERYLSYFLSDGEKLMVAYAYGTQVAGEAESFIHALKKMGYLTKFVLSTKLTPQEIIHPARNVELTVDVLSAVDKLDIIVLGSNDTELIPLITHLQGRGIKVIVATPSLEHFKGNVNVDLLSATDLIESIQAMREKR